MTYDTSISMLAPGTGKTQTARVWMDHLQPEEPQGAEMTKPPERSKVVRKLRCTVYTRKSSEEGLAQEFDSLDLSS